MSKPAEPRDAATVVVSRDGSAGVEVYLVKRSRAVDFMAGAHVFPVGRLDPADSSLEACAVRETGEEAALVLDPATAKSIEMLLAFASVEAALAEAARRPHLSSCRWSGTTRKAATPISLCRAIRATPHRTSLAGRSAGSSWRKGATGGSMPAESAKLK